MGSTKRRLTLFLTAALLLGALLAVPGQGALQAQGSPSWQFGLFGDVPYGPEGERELPALMAAMDAADLAFVVHDGDIKSGATLCSNDWYGYMLGVFQASVHPLIYVPGDNEWTDCHRENNGSYDPLERLAVLRRMFFPDNLSLGQRRIPLERQSVNPAYAQFRENVLWSHGDITFVGLHVIGSNNNLGRDAANDAEYVERNLANLAWLRQSFARARQDNSRAMMLILQANLWDGPAEQRTGFADFLAVLEEETLALAPTPVVLVHGDSHYFRIDKPLMSRASGRRVENFTRVETFGEWDNHWLRVYVDYGDPNIFVFSPGIVPENLVQHVP
jgi:hypothetical protein